MAGTAKAVIIDARHHTACDRLLTLRLLSLVYEQRYRYLAAEKRVDGYCAPIGNTHFKLPRTP